ncbi:hypothetical protein ACP70R_020208 [Stipagrostis hirtigluma subsp. patula]
MDPDQVGLLVSVVGASVAVAVFVALVVAVSYGYWNNGRRRRELRAARPPPPAESAQMAAVAITLLDNVTHTRQTAAGSSASTAASTGGDGSTELTGAASEDCAICLGKFEDGDRCSVMPVCGHHFHRGCIATWLMACKNTCPLCRTQLQWYTVAGSMA